MMGVTSFGDVPFLPTPSDGSWIPDTTIPTSKGIIGRETDRDRTTKGSREFHSNLAIHVVEGGDPKDHARHRRGECHTTRTRRIDKSYPTSTHARLKTTLFFPSNVTKTMRQTKEGKRKSTTTRQVLVLGHPKMNDEYFCVHMAKRKDTNGRSERFKQIAMADCAFIATCLERVA